MWRRDFLRTAALGALGVAAPLVAPARGAPATAAPSSEPGAAVGAGAASDVVTVDVITRRAWGARPPVAAKLERHRPVRLTLHHTDVRMTRRRSAVTEVRGIQDWHLDSKGHADIDYHFVVDRRGHVFQGRNLRFRGDTATEYDPSGHFLVCCLGDYQGGPAPAQEPTRAMLRSVVLLFAWASQRWDIPPGLTGGHRDFAATSCPGRELYRLVRNGTLRRRITRVSTTRTVQLRALPTAQGRRLVERIDAGSA